MRPRCRPFLTIAVLVLAMLAVLAGVVVVMHARLPALNDARGAPDGPPAMRLLPPPLPNRPTTSSDASPGYDVAGGPPAAYTKLLTTEIEKWRQVIKTAGIKAN